MTDVDRDHDAAGIGNVDDAKLRALLAVAVDLSSTLELSEVLQKAIEAACDLLSLDTGAIYLLKDADLYLGATTPPLPADFPEHLRRAPLADHGHIQEALHTRKPVLLEDALASELTSAEREVCEVRRLRTVLYVPLLVLGRPIGAFIVGSCDVPHRLGEADVALCATLAYAIALAVNNAALFESVRSSAAEIATAYDAEIERRGRLRELAIAASEADARHDAWIADELSSRVLEPIAEFRSQLETAAAAWGVDSADARLSELLEKLTDIAAAAYSFRTEFILPSLDTDGFQAALETICEHQLGAGIPFTVEVAEDVKTSGTPIDRFLLSAASELLRSINRHTSASHVNVTLTKQGDDFLLAISDDDTAGEPSLDSSSHPRSLGLFTLSERAAHLGGRLDVTVAPSAGTVVRVALPSKEWALPARSV